MYKTCLKKTAQINSMPYTYGRFKTMIEQRRKTYKGQLDTIQQEMTQYMEHKPDLILETNEILKILKDFIEKDQYQSESESNRLFLDRVRFGSFFFLKAGSSSVRFECIFKKSVRVRFGSSTFPKNRFEFGSIL